MSRRAKHHHEQWEIRRWTGREDLLEKVRRILAAPNLTQVSAQQIADFIREPAEQVWDCLDFLTGPRQQLVTAPPDIQGKKRKVLFGMKWRIDPIEQKRLDETPILMFLETPEEKELQCPGCGRPLKRRHKRGEYHDSHKCQMDNLRDIMGN